MEAADADDSDDPEPDEAVVAHLVPSGPSPARVAVAALITAALFGGAAAHFGRDLELAPFCVFFAMLVVISVTDLTHRLVPRRLIYGALALIVPLLVATSAVDHSWHDLTGSVVAGAVAFGLFFGIWWFIPRGMGFGDVRLAGIIGLVVGLPEPAPRLRGLPGRLRDRDGVRPGADGGLVGRAQDPHPVRPVAGRGGGASPSCGEATWPTVSSMRGR